MTTRREIADYLASKSLGTVGTDLFTARLPEKPDVCIAVLDTQGLGPGRVHENAGISTERPGVQVLVRDTNYAAGEARAQLAMQYLDRVANTTLSGVRYLRIATVSTPIPFRDENDRPCFSINAMVEKAPSTVAP